MQWDRERPAQARRRRTANILRTLHEALVVAQKVRDTARQQGREEFAQQEDRMITQLQERIARIEERAAALELREQQLRQGDRPS
jgi:hypothetical protein